MVMTGPETRPAQWVTLHNIYVFFREMWCNDCSCMCTHECVRTSDSWSQASWNALY